MLTSEFLPLLDCDRGQTVGANRNQYTSIGGVVGWFELLGRK